MPNYRGGNYLAPTPYIQNTAGLGGLDSGGNYTSLAPIRAAQGNYVDATGATIEVPDSALPVSYVLLGALAAWLLYRSATKESRESRTRMGRGPARVYSVGYRKPPRKLEKSRWVIMVGREVKSKHATEANAMKRLRMLHNAGYKEARVVDTGSSSLGH